MHTGPALRTAVLADSIRHRDIRPAPRRLIIIIAPATAWPIVTATVATAGTSITASTATVRPKTIAQTSDSPAGSTPTSNPSDGCFGGFDPAPGNPTRATQTNNYYRTGNGLAYRYSYSRDGRHFYYGVHGNGQTQNYRADVGFTRRLNTNF